MEMQAGKMPKIGVHIDASRAEYDYVTLKDLIASAYAVRSYQIAGPAWLASERFDIVAKLPDGASKDDAPKMLQKLLEERFKLTVHRDTQEYPILALVVGKDGPKLKQSTATAKPIDPTTPLKPGETKLDASDGQQIRMTQNADGSAIINMGANGKITERVDTQSQTVHMDADTVTMAGFAEMLTSLMKLGGGGSSQVVDKTELKGNYQVSVDISLASLIAMVKASMPELGSMLQTGGGAGEASDPEGGSTLYASVQKLGLKLEKRKVKEGQLVIDHIEKTPTAN
jgi:uncharacterized protein (TIGR03435 family)